MKLFVQRGETMTFACIVALYASLLSGCNGAKQEAQSEKNTMPVEQGQLATKAIPAPLETPRRTVDAERAMRYVQDQVAFGRRALGTPGHKKVQDYILAKLKDEKVEQDKFTAKTPVGDFEMSNIIAKFPGTKDGIIVIASHYDTLASVKNFVGANDGASSTGLLLEIANQFHGKPNPGPEVWLVFFDGEEAFKTWSSSDSTYGSRHLAGLWEKDGTAKKIKALILLDMVGDKDLNIENDDNSTKWLRDTFMESAQTLGYQSYFYKREQGVDDDHTPFLKLDVPCIDIIDFDYGYNNVFWHTADDTLDKLSPKSLQIVGDVTLDAVRRINIR